MKMIYCNSGACSNFSDGFFLNEGGMCSDAAEHQLKLFFLVEGSCLPMSTDVYWIECMP